MDTKKNMGTMRAALLGALFLTALLVVGTLWSGVVTERDTNEAVHSVSLLYLDELAGRREQVVADNLQDNINVMNIAIELMTEDDLSDTEHLQAYQTRMKRLFNLESFAFVDETGLIWRTQGTDDGIDSYDFDIATIDGPEVSVRTFDDGGRRVVIAVPTDHIPFQGHELVACFMEMDMEVMLRGVSMQSQESSATFCNIYTSDGVALSNTILGGLAVEDNLLEAMENAQFEEGYTLEGLRDDFAQGRRGEVSFTYNGIQETLSYVPVEGTDWLLTYLIRESVISERIGSVTDGIMQRSLLQSGIIVATLVSLFGVITLQIRESSREALERETAEAANQARREELEHRLELQDRLLERERQKKQQDELIGALSADYWSVYYLELDKDEGVCYQSHSGIEGGFAVGERFRYLESVTAYAKQYIDEHFLDEFLAFVQPDAIRAGLAKARIISYRYMVHRKGQDSYEMVRFASASHANEDSDQPIQAVGACFIDVDEETRRTLAQNEALSEALTAAEEASKAKTAFLSNMSHEIRTPMNAIIGLDRIALNDSDISESTRSNLEKIGDSATHLLGLINDILDMSRIESGRMTLRNEEFSFPRLLEAINTIFSGQCQDKGLDYQCHIKGQVDDYYIGDSMKLRQVLINILGNAVKFTPAGGGVSLDVERVASFEGKTTLRFVISDTGIGMSKEYLPHIFDTFSQEDSSTTSKYGSSGLGMAITKNIVEMMNGSIEVESEKGAGTTFTVTVTMMDSEHVQGEDDEDELHPQDMNVLVVDDDPVACEHAKLVLEGAGIAAETVASGAEAVEMVQLREARRDPYDLILVDWQMPEMDGVETTRRIREIAGNGLAIVILTAYRWDDVLEEATEAGVDAFISKPLFAATVLDEFRGASKRKGVAKLRSQNRAKLEGRRILLAEDMAVNAEIMTMVLQMRQIEVDLAQNGRIAVDMFAEHEPGYYDAILMDMRMPEMDGLEATRTIRTMDREDAKRIPIIALTANAFDEDVQRSLQAGLNAHLTKPVEPDNLFDTLESLIEP